MFALRFLIEDFFCFYCIHKTIFLLAQKKAFFHCRIYHLILKKIFFFRKFLKEKLRNILLVVCNSLAMATMSEKKFT